MIVKIYKTFLKKCLFAYAECPEEKEIRIVVNDELERRNIQRSMERLTTATSSGVPVDISLNDRSLVLKGSDLDRVINRLDDIKNHETALSLALKNKNITERRKQILKLFKSGGEMAVNAVLTALINSGFTH